MNTLQPVVRVRHLSKKYYIGQYTGQRLLHTLRHKEDTALSSQEILALNDVSFDVYPGDAFGIIGRNGAGKSTLLKILCEITTPTHGEVDVVGRISSMLEVGSGFDKELTGRENIYLNGTILGMTREEVDAKIADIIEFSELGKFIDTPVKRYSSGMYTKLAFSVAANLDNEIIVMDEILAVGDVAFREKCVSKIKSKVAGGKTIIYVGHNMNYLKRLCDRCLVLDQGKAVFLGDTEDAVQFYLDNIEKAAREKEKTRPASSGSLDIKPYAALRNKGLFGLGDASEVLNEYPTLFLGPRRDISEKERSALLTDHRVHLNEVYYVNKNDITFAPGETAVMTFRFDVLEDYDDVNLQVEVWTVDDKLLSSLDLNHLGPGHRGEAKEVTAYVELDNFIPAIYKFKHTFYFIAPSGNAEEGSVPYDHIATDRVVGLSFQIRDDSFPWDSWDITKMGYMRMQGGLRGGKKDQ